MARPALALFVALMLVSGGCGTTSSVDSLDGSSNADGALGGVPSSPEVSLSDAASPTDGPSVPMSPQSFTVVVLPDTQWYARHYPEIFESQAKWIVQKRQQRQIAFVLHEGDIIDTNEIEGGDNRASETEWQVASKMLHMLDGVVPYVLATGNHDSAKGPMLGVTGLFTKRDAPLMNKYFPVSMFMKNPWWKGTFEPNKIQNSYQIIPGGNRDWLIVSLEFGPRDEVLAWADNVLRDNAALPAIIVTHAYMYEGSERYDWAKFMFTQSYNPLTYFVAGQANDGEMMWDKLVSKHDNVKLVVSGHVAPGTAGRLTSTRPNGTRVHQLLANFQLCVGISIATDECHLAGTDPSFWKGGGGFLRLMMFDPMKAIISVKTYSPYLDQWKTTPEHQFELDLE